MQQKNIKQIQLLLLFDSICMFYVESHLNCLKSYPTKGTMYINSNIKVHELLMDGNYLCLLNV